MLRLKSSGYVCINKVEGKLQTLILIWYYPHIYLFKYGYFFYYRCKWSVQKQRFSKKYVECGSVFKAARQTKSRVYIQVVR